MIKWQYLINRRKTWSRENTAFAAILSIILYDIGNKIYSYETVNEKNNYFQADGSDVLNMLTTGHSPIPIQYTGYSLFEIRLNMTD